MNGERMDSAPIEDGRLHLEPLSRPGGSDDGGVRLVLMRHAKSDYPLGVRDHDRPLNDRGRSDAAAAGTWLVGNATALLGARPVVLVSSAVRTQQTWQIAGAGLGLTAASEGRLYEASDHAYLDVLRDGLAESDTVLVIGHNPSTESVARRLIVPDESVDYRAMTTKFPTSAIAVIDLPDAGLRAGCGRLAAFVIPRGTRPRGERG